MVGVRRQLSQMIYDEQFWTTQKGTDQEAAGFVGAHADGLATRLIAGKFSLT